STRCAAQHPLSRRAEAGRVRRSVVAVVGAAHVPGISSQLGTPTDRTELERIPPPSRTWRAVRWLLPRAFGLALLHGWRSDPGLLVSMLRAWYWPIALAAGAATL